MHHRRRQSRRVHSCVTDASLTRCQTAFNTHLRRLGKHRMAEELRGWHPDPYGVHELRYFASGGTPTRLVRDGDRVSNDEPPRSLPQLDHRPSAQSQSEQTSTPATAYPRSTQPTQPSVREQARPAPTPSPASFAEDRSVWTARIEPASVPLDVCSNATTPIGDPMTAPTPSAPEMVGDDKPAKMEKTATRRDENAGSNAEQIVGAPSETGTSYVASIRRTRHVSSRWIWLLRPLFRYSQTIGGYVLRAGGRSRGPILHPKQKGSDLPTISPLVEHPPWRDPPNLWPPFIGDGVVDRREDGQNGRTVLVGSSERFTDSDEDPLSGSGNEKEPRIPQKLTVGKGLMRPYNEANPCPKCGSTKASVQYHDPGTGHKGCDPGEHIHRECLTCGYPWSDACLELDENHPIVGMATEEAL
jgi:hypothetical protein